MSYTYKNDKRIVCHLTTVHTRTDTRIRVKQTASLTNLIGKSVVLFVQDGQRSEKDRITGVEVVNTGPKISLRLLRMTLGALRMWWAVRRARPSVAHFHDPELIPVGILLKLSGAKVVYDIHEDLPRQLLGKFWLPAVFSKPVAWAMEVVEWIADRCFDAVVPATPKIAERFSDNKTVVVQNFPLLEELVVPDSGSYQERPPYFAYVGGITRARGVKEMISAIEKVPCDGAMLCFAGAFMPQVLQAEAEALTGWNRVDFMGWADREQVAKLLGKVRAGLVLFHPGPNHCSAQPNKMFEYMAAGLPVIASNFALWREIIAGAGCGILVDPLDPDAIAHAMQWMLENPREAEIMGRRGRQAVEKKYNWEQESEKLISLYRRLLEN